MDFNEYEISNSEISLDVKYSDEVEFLVTQLNEMAHMAGRYNRGVQLRKASYILEKLESIRLNGKEQNSNNIL